MGIDSVGAGKADLRVEHAIQASELPATYGLQGAAT